MDSAQLGAFLRSRRERITPDVVGLPAGRRRRTPGLRRDEVAHLAFISTEYYTRLEQGRAARPSTEVVAGLSRALRLDDAERIYLHRLAGAEPSPPIAPPHEVRPSVQVLLERLPLSAAIVVSASYEIIAWNALACALMEDFSVLSRRDRNIARKAFLEPTPDGRGPYGVSEPEAFARTCALRLRSVAARYPDDPDTAALITELRSGSPLFARIWADHDVTAETLSVKTFHHPVVGPVTVNCDVLDIADRDQRVTFYTAEPGSASEDAMRVLSSLGARQLARAL